MSAEAVVAGSVAQDGEAELARALLAHAARAFRVLPEIRRAEPIAAIDDFLAHPSPARFLAAVRVLGATRRRYLLESRGEGTLRRARADGLAALRAVPGLPAAMLARLDADLPLDVRSGSRLHALAALARAYDELAGRVAADMNEMRRRLQPAIRRARAGRKPS